MNHTGSHANAGGQLAVCSFHPTQDPIHHTDGSTHAMGTGSKGGCATIAIALAAQVRRLTPTECERLQGFPDGYTFVPTWDGWRYMDASETPEQCRADGMEVRQTKGGRWRVKDAGGPRYKALGNSMAVPVMRWIGRRVLREMGDCAP